MFGIGGFELILILLFGFLIFGPDKLPEIAKGASKMIANLRNMQAQVSEVIKTEVYDPNSDEPFKNPLDVLTRDGKEGDAKKTATSDAAEAKPAKEESGKSAEVEAKEAKSAAKKPAGTKATAARTATSAATKKKSAAKAEPAEKKEGEE